MRFFAFVVFFSMALVIVNPTNALCNDVIDNQNTSSDINTENDQNIIPKKYDGVTMTTLKYMVDDGNETVTCYVPYFNKKNIDEALMKRATNVIMNALHYYSSGEIFGGVLTYEISYIGKNSVVVTEITDCVGGSWATRNSEYYYNKRYFDLKADKEIKMVDYFVGGEKGVVNDIIDHIKNKVYADNPDGFNLCKKAIQEYYNSDISYRFNNEFSLSDEGFSFIEPRWALDVGEHNCMVDFQNHDLFIPYAEMKHAKPKKEYFDKIFDKKK